MADEKRRATAHADDVPEPEKAARDAQREAAREVDEDAQTFPVERLLGPDAYTLTGYEGHIVAGALVGVSKKNLTIDEVKAACAAWLDSPVKEA
jgi:hypothetical protein